jgi:hypothetical protein
MQRTRKLPQRPAVRGLVLALAVSALSSQLAQAHPYASGVTNNAGTVSFILNESADSVQVAFDKAGAGYTSTNSLGALAAGMHSFALGAHTNYAVIVSKGGNGIPFKISTDTNPLVNFALPEGIAVNKNPKTANFGRIYVCNSSPGAAPSTWGGVVTRTTTQGVYLLNADQSDAVGQGDNALTAGLSMDVTVNASAVPYKISVGPDDMVYFGDCRGRYGTPHYAGDGTGIYMAAPDFSTGQGLFPFASTTMFGGVDGKPCVSGSLATSNLVVYAYEWDSSTPADPMVWQYNIGAGPLPWATPPPTFFVDAWGGVGVNYVEGDTTLSPDGSLLYVALDRGTPGSSQPPLCIYRTNSFTGTTLQQANAIWNVEAAWGTTKDVFQYLYSFDISADGQELATANGLAVHGPIAVISLTNGIPDLGTYHCIDTDMDDLNATWTANNYSIRGVCYDAAGNVYASTRAGFIRVYSPGQSTVAVTANDWTGTNGTFAISKSALTPRSIITGPQDLDLTGTLVAAEYYGAQSGAFYISGVPFINNNARIGGTAGAVANTPNFGTSQDALNLATISAADSYAATFSFSVPGTAGHSYKLQMLFHDNYSGTAAVRNREFDVKVGNGVALAYNLDLALLDANLTKARDVVLTYSYTNTDGSPLPITMRSEADNAEISALILKDTTPGAVIAPVISANPQSLSKLAGQTATFLCAALGTSPTYQWQAGVVGSGTYTNLINGGRFSGVNSAVLTIANLKVTDQLDYVLKATNSAGQAVSGPATLTVTPLGNVATVAAPADLGLGVGSVVAAEYYGTDVGPLTIGTTVFHNNNARIPAVASGGGFTGAVNTPNFGASADAVSLSTISAADAWAPSLDFTIPTVAGRNYLLKLLLHDNTFDTVGTRVFTVAGGLQSGGLGQLGPQIDLVQFGAYETQPADLMLTLGVTNSDGSAIEVQMSSIVQNPMISALILEDVSSGTVPPEITLQPQSNVTLYSGHTTNLFAVVGGTSLIYQWQMSTDGGGTWNNLTDSAGSVAGSTTPSLTLTVSSAVPNAQYQLVAHNTAGSVTTTPAAVTVLSGPPLIITGGDLPAAQAFRVGQTLNLAVQVDGNAPFTFAWQRSPDGGTTWNPVTNGGRTSGATSNVLTILNAQTNDAAVYRLSVLDDQSGGTPTLSAMDTVTVLYGAASFNNDGTGWTLNGDTPSIANNIFVLTVYNAPAVHRTAFYSAPVYVGAFKAGFTYTDSSGFLAGDAADGGAFVLQNDPSGATYLGDGGGGLAYTGKGGPSFALCWDLYIYDPGHIGTPGWLWSTNAADVGDSANPFRTSGSVGFLNTSPMDVSLLYNGGQLTLTLTQNGNVFQNVINSINLPAMLGANTAFVGLTGADGSLSSDQSVSNFYFEPLVALSSQVTGTNTVLLSWEKNSGLVLESTSSLTSGVWQTVPVGTVAGQAVIPLSGGSQQFYRLSSPLP